MADGIGGFLGAAGVGSAIGQAIVQLELDTKKYQAELAAAEGKTVASANKMSSGLAAFGGIAKAGFAALAVGAVAFGVNAVKAASDLGESLNKSNVVFGQNAGAIEKWAHTGADAFGLSARASLDAAANFGTMLQSAGLATDASAKMSQSLVVLSGDLASFNNVDPTIALEKLRAGLAGEAEPLRQFGVFLSEAAVQQEAYSSGIAEVGAELTEAQKVQARYNIIFAQTTKQQGDFARTADSLPNQLRSMRAEFENVSAEVGTQLLPVITTLLGVFKELIPLLGLIAENLTLILTALAGYAALKFLPGLLFSMAAGFEAMGFAAASQHVLQTAFGVAEMGAAFATAVAPALAFGAAFAGITAAVAAWDPLQLVDDTNQLRKSMEVHDVVLGRVARSSNLVGESNAQWGGTMVTAEEQAKLLQSSVEGLATSQREGVGAASAAAQAHREVADALREELDATLALIDPTFALINAVRDQEDAQREYAQATALVIRLEEDGKKGTKEYTEARRAAKTAALAAAEAEVDVAAAARALQTAITEGHASRQQINRDLADIGRAAGLSGKEIRGLQEDVRSGLSVAAALARRLAPGVGESLMFGIRDGIVAGSDDLATAVREGVRGAINAGKDEAGAESPSKVMKELGLDMMEGLYQGITTGAQKVIDAARKSIEKLISQISSQLDKVKGLASEFAGTISGAIGGFGDIGGPFTSALQAFQSGQGQEGFTGSAPNLSEIIQQQLAGAQALADALEALKRQGAGKALLEEAAEAGLDFAQALLQGGPETIQEANAALKTIADLAKETGKGLSEKFFGDKIDRLEKRLEKQNDQLHELVELERLGHSHAIILNGQKVSEAVRDELIKTGKRNDGTGIN